MEKSMMGIESELEPLESVAKVNWEGIDLRLEDSASALTNELSVTWEAVAAISIMYFSL